MQIRNLQGHKQKKTVDEPALTKLVIIAGCSRLGAELALRFNSAGYSVIVVDPNQSALAQLNSSFGGVAFEGEASDPEILKRCSVDEAGMLFAVTDDDATNLLIGKMAETIFHVPEVHIRLESGSNRAALAGSKIQVICPPEILASHILDDIRRLEVQP